MILFSYTRSHKELQAHEILKFVLIYVCKWFLLLNKKIWIRNFIRYNKYNIFPFFNTHTQKCSFEAERIKRREKKTKQ